MKRILLSLALVLAPFGLLAQSGGDALTLNCATDGIGISQGTVVGYADCADVAGELAGSFPANSIPAAAVVGGGSGTGSATQAVTAVANSAALDAITTNSTVTAAQGALNPPLAMGGTVEHTEFSNGNAVQVADRYTPTGIYLSTMRRMRVGGTWANWTNDGDGLGKTIIKWTSVLEDNELEANRATISRTAYADLWEYAQNSGRYDPTGADTASFGPGDGSTTFDLFDGRAEFLRGWDNGRGIDVGRAFGSSQGDLGRVPMPLARNINPGGNDDTGLRAARSSSSAAVADQEIGGSENRPRNMPQMFAIKF